LRNASLCARRIILSPRITHQISPNVPFLAPIAAPAAPKFRFFSSESGENSTTAPESSPTDSPEKKDLVVEDVSNKGKTHSILLFGYLTLEMAFVLVEMCEFNSHLTISQYLIVFN